MIRKTAYLTCIAALTACSNSVETDGPFFLGDSKAPVALSVGVEMTAKPKRAVDHTFETGDKMVAHLQHVLKEGETYTTQGVFEKNVILTMRSNPAMSQVGETMWQTDNFDTDPALYWDDFSSTAHDIRTASHGLRLAWGYCYNDPAATDAEYTAATDVQHRSVLADQTAGIQTSDLLWAKSQEMVPYEHGTQNQDTKRKGLVIPYTHAMSKATIVVTADETFGATPFAATTVTLHNVHTAGTFTASTAEVSRAYTSGDITMRKSATGRTATFDAVFVPHTALAEGKLWATLTDVEGNSYEIRLNNKILADGKWGAISETKSGVNYLLNVTISKQQITVMAQIADWDMVNATGTGIIQFVPDITTTGTIADDLKTGGTDIYKSGSPKDFTTKSTTLTWNEETTTWTYTNPIYWAGQSDASYFRALSPAGTTTEMAQGHDVLWGYACDDEADKALVGTEAEKTISPRTGDVPLHFEHAMSKVTFRLSTAAEDAAKVDLDGATLRLTHLATTGTLNKDKGTIAPDATTDDAYTVTHTATGSPLHTLTITNGEIFIPQTISDDARLILTLKDGTTYSLQLNLCKDNSKNTIGAWAQGKHYIYDITVAKEAITFRAVVKNWVEAKGNGNANLDWD
ncbi:MAG: fimbrillin family protein [Bacteroidales bacterium]|nr:fimbrillin family protein [Bacteroidales bacterium]